MPGFVFGVIRVFGAGLFFCFAGFCVGFSGQVFAPGLNDSGFWCQAFGPGFVLGVIRGFGVGFLVR